MQILIYASSKMFQIIRNQIYHIYMATVLIQQINQSGRIDISEAI